MGTKAQVKEPKYYWYAINRNKDRRGQIAGSMRWAGSVHFHMPRRTLVFSWYLFRQATSPTAIEYQRGNWTEGRQWHVAIRRLVALFLAIEKFNDKPERNIGVRVFDGSVWWVLWEDPNEWHRGSRQYTWHVRDWIIGKPKYSTRDLDAGTVDVPMPEGVYPATYTEREAIWTRARGKTKRVHRYTFEFGDGGIPVPGKGENVWDLDDDEIQTITVNAQSLHEAVGDVVACALRDRYRYGGRNWKPED